MTLFLVEVFLVLSQVRVHLLLTLQLVLKNAQMSLVMGFFALFPTEKSAECRAGQCGPAPACQLIHAGGSARLVVGATHSCSVGRVGAGQGRSEEGAREQEEEEEEEEEEAAEVL